MERHAYLFRPFLYHTSSRKVYPVQVALPQHAVDENNTGEYFKDHHFDQIDLRNVNGRTRRDDITKGNGPLKGVQGLRSNYYKVNEGKIPMEQRLGIVPSDSLTTDDCDWLDANETG